MTLSHIRTLSLEEIDLFVKNMVVTKQWGVYMDYGIVERILHTSEGVSHSFVEGRLLVILSII